MVKKWTPEQFWEYVEGLAGDFNAGQMRDMLAERGLSLAAPEPRSCGETTQSSDGGVEGHAQTVPWPTRGRAASDGVADQSLACTLGTLPPAGIKPGPSDAIAEILRRTFGADDVIATGCAARIVAVFPSTAMTASPDAVEALKVAVRGVLDYGWEHYPTTHPRNRRLKKLADALAALSAAPVSAPLGDSDKLMARKIEDAWGIEPTPFNLAEVAVRVVRDEISRKLDRLDGLSPPRNERESDPQHNLPGHDETVAGLSSLSIFGESKP